MDWGTGVTTRKLRSLPELKRECERLRDEGRKGVLCHGVFDLLHPGHLKHLAAAKAEGDYLVVTVTPDKLVNKGPGRPVYAELQRVEMLASLEVVDFVAVNDAPTATSTILRLRPDVYAKGADYIDRSADPTGNISDEEDAVVSCGGRIHFTDEPSLSSSKLINAHMAKHDEPTREWLADFRARYSVDEVLAWLDAAAKVRALVIGEAIIDEYVVCEALGKSSKDPVIAFREMGLERQAGGSAAIANHCGGLGAEVKSIFRLGIDERDHDLLLGSLHERVTPGFTLSETEPTIIKRRFIDDLTEARVFETYIMSEDAATPSDRKRFRELLEASLKDVDLVIVADYGHGLLTEDVIGDLAGSGKRLAVNTQSNAGNRGFNTISKYTKPGFVCLNGGEMALELRRRHLTVDELVPQLHERTGADRVIVTAGAQGLVCCESDSGTTHVPAFAPNVRDRVGAGDALFAMTSLLSAAGAPADVTGLFGNLAGAVAVGQLGNRTHLVAGDIARHAIALLK